MSIFDNLRVQPTQMQYRDTIAQARTTMKIDQWADVGYHGFGVTHEYRLSLGVEQIFRANQAQFEQAREAALRAAADYLYEGVHKELSYIRVAVFGGDAEGVLAAVDRLQKAITP